MVKTYIGSAVTDKNGIATVKYEGVGAGVVEIVAETDTLQSNTCTVEDYLYYDDGVTDPKPTGEWNASSNLNVSITDEGTTVSATVTSSFASTKDISGDFEAILQCTDVSDEGYEGIRIGFSDGTKNLRAIISSTTERFVKFTRVGSTWTAQISTDGTSWSNIQNIDASTLSTEDCHFLINIIHTASSTGHTRALKYRNLKVYKI